jgi:aryl-alcohol dehydrogenase-like predicted oxidoreductase
LAELRDEGKIHHLALTNFDTEHMQIILDHGIRIVSNQVQYSLIDRRPEVRMRQFCQAHDIQLLTYGTVGGGLLSDTYYGQPEPTRAALNTASLRKYKQMVDAWLLGVLKRLADKHRVSIANIALRYILDRPAVGGVIIGVRLGVAEHREDNARSFGVRLDAEDQAQIEAVLGKSRDLYQLIGDCGDEYRR